MKKTTMVKIEKNEVYNELCKDLNCNNDEEVVRCALGLLRLVVNTVEKNKEILVFGCADFQEYCEKMLPTKELPHI